MDVVKKFVSEIFHRKRKSGSLSDRPVDWKKTTTDLYNEMHSGKRSLIPQKELEWAEDYQRSLIPSEYKFPKKGYVYESLEDQNVEIEIWYRAPGSGSDDSVLFKGEQVWIYYDTKEDAVEVCALPLEYDVLELRMVSKDFQDLSFYSGFSIVIKTTILNEKFKLVRKNYKPEGKN